MRIVFLSKTPIKWLELPSQGFSESSGLVAIERDTILPVTDVRANCKDKNATVSQLVKPLNPLKEEGGSSNDGAGKPLVCERCGAVGAAAKYKGKIVCPDCLKREQQEDYDLA